MFLEDTSHLASETLSDWPVRHSFQLVKHYLKEITLSIILKENVLYVVENIF